MKKIVFLLFVVCLLIACDEDKIQGNVYGCVNSVECHLQDKALDCIEKNPLVGPIDGNFQDDAIFGSGEIEEISWENTTSWFLPSKNHQYGFDIDPLSFLPDYAEKGQNVYISVKTGEKASLRVYVDQTAKEVYRLHKIDDSNNIIEKDVLLGLDVCETSNCVKEIKLSKGKYAVYYGTIDKKRYLHIIEYDENIKQIYFVQFGSEEYPDCYHGIESGCYTLERVQERFNEIYKQAVVSAQLNEKEPSFFGFDNDLYVDLSQNKNTNERMTDYANQIIMALNPELKRRLEKYEESRKELSKMIDKLNKKKQSIENCDSHYINCNIIEKEYYTLKNDVAQFSKIVEDNHYSVMMYSKIHMWSHHVVLGINKMTIGWKLPNSTNGQNYILENYQDYNKACSIYHQRTYDEGCLNIRFPMYLRNECDASKQEIEAEMYNFDKENNTFNLKLYNANNLNLNCEYTLRADVHPFVPGLPYALQYSTIITNNFQNGFPHQGGRVIGGIVWGAHTSGNNSLNIINHEIGHIYGLSDLYVLNNDPIYSTGLATDETNLMNYIFPIGPKIRYRPLEAVYTSTNKRIEINGEYATENQWECIRSNQKCIIQ